MASHSLVPERPIPLPQQEVAYCNVCYTEESDSFLSVEVDHGVPIRFRHLQLVQREAVHEFLFGGLSGHHPTGGFELALRSRHHFLCGCVFPYPKNRRKGETSQCPY